MLVSRDRLPTGPASARPAHQALPTVTPQAVARPRPPHPAHTRHRSDRPEASAALSHSPPPHQFPAGYAYPAGRISRACRSYHCEIGHEALHKSKTKVVMHLSAEHGKTLQGDVSGHPSCAIHVSAHFGHLHAGPSPTHGASQSRTSGSTTSAHTIMRGQGKIRGGDLQAPRCETIPVKSGARARWSVARRDERRLKKRCGQRSSPWQSWEQLRARRCGAPKHSRRGGGGW